MSGGNGSFSGRRGGKFFPPPLPHYSVGQFGDAEQFSFSNVVKLVDSAMKEQAFTVEKND